MGIKSPIVERASERSLTVGCLIAEFSSFKHLIQSFLVKTATLRQFRVFASVAKYNSFARPAEELHPTPPASSMQIKELGDCYQLPLFERVGKGVRLTMPGEYLLAYARRVLATLKEADAMTAALRGVRGGRLRSPW